MGRRWITRKGNYNLKIPNFFLNTNPKSRGDTGRPRSTWENSLDVGTTQQAYRSKAEEEDICLLKFLPMLDEH